MKSLDSTFFAQNRERAMEKLKGGLLVIAGYAGMQKTNDEELRFVQESNMWYLTGIEFADWWLIMDAKRGKSWLVEPDIDEHLRLFTESLLIDNAKKVSGITEIISRDQAMSMLRTAAKTHQLVYTIDNPPHIDRFGFVINPALHEMRQRLERTFAKVEDFRLDLARIRAIKQPIELEVMQAAIDLTIDALTDVKSKLTDYKHEYEIEADLSRAFRVTGGDGHGFDPVIASGANTTKVHYFTNNSPLKKGTFVMLDVGAQVAGYPADLTRTYAYGKPTKRMVAVHDAVREAQQEIISLIRPGLYVEEYYKQVDEIIKKSMMGLGIIRSMDDEEKFRRHMPHAISHGLGVDVHDALGRPTEFLPGMVLTVEPGIYLQDDGIGVRIEDDILVTETGHKNLSAKLSTSL